MRVLTVGTGMAAADFVQRLRQDGFSGEIVMMGDEPFAPYSPCIIPFFLAGEPEQSVYWKGEDFYQRYRVTALLSDAVVEVDQQLRTVRTASGRSERYDTLFYAAGSRSWYPDPQWRQTKGVFGFKTLSDMLEIDHYIRQQQVRRAVVFGGGFIGLDAALALRTRGLEVSIVHRNNRLLSQMTDEDGGTFATERLSVKAQLNVYLRCTVQQLRVNAGELAGVTLSDGTDLECTLLIVAVGVTPNSRALTGDDSGVSADDQMQVSRTVYAAGDVAVTRHLVSGVPGLYANYPNARQQAETAARHLCHGTGHYTGSLNSTVLRKHLDFPVISVGEFSGDNITWQRGDSWRRVYLRDGLVNGFIIIGDTRLSGYLHHAYLERKPVDEAMRRVLAEPRKENYFREVLGLSFV